MVNQAHKNVRNGRHEARHTELENQYERLIFISNKYKILTKNALLNGENDVNNI